MNKIKQFLKIDPSDAFFFQLVAVQAVVLAILWTLLDPSVMTCIAGDNLFSKILVFAGRTIFIMSSFIFICADVDYYLLLSEDDSEEDEE